jgi:hypothetical protein
MPRATIYNRDGTVNRITDCVDMHPHCGNFRLLVVKKDDDNMRRMMGDAKDDVLILNLPMAVEGLDRSNIRQPEDTDPEHRVTLVSDDGTELRIWNKAKCVYFQSDLVTFNVDGVWHSVTGSILIEDDR